MRVPDLSRGLIRILEGIALLALYGSSDVNPVFFGGMGIAAAVFFGWERSRDHQKGLLPDKVLIYGFIVVTGVSVFSVWKLHVHPLMAASHAILSVMLLSWPLASSVRNLGWRLVLAFLTLIIASSLSPEFYLAALILVFVILSSLLLFSLFLENEFKDKAPEELSQAFSFTFLSQAILTSLLVFLVSLALFPLLPRPIQNGGLNWGGTQVGYSENVELSGRMGFSETSNRKPALRLFLPHLALEEILPFFPKFLLRARVLEVFDGSRWIGRGLYSGAIIPPLIVPQAGEIVVPAVREPLPSNILPVPYRSSLLLAHPEDSGTIALSPRGEWFGTGDSGDRISYQILLAPDLTRKNEELPDRMREVLTRFPQVSANALKKWKDLAKVIFGTARTPLQKIRSVERYFQSTQFRAEMVPVNDFRAATAIQNLELFLFVERVGYCEYFASATAFLLRLEDIPTRLVTGFRISSSPVADVLTLRQEDAHAWVEAWDPQLGWVAVDPTPTRFRSGLEDSSPLRDLRDFFEAYWYRYVVGYAGANPTDTALKLTTSLKGLESMGKSFDIQDTLLPILAGLIALGLALAFLTLWFRRNRRVTRGLASILGYPFPLFARARNRQLRRRRNRFNRILSQTQAQNSLEVSAWKRTYQYLRFGPVDPRSPAWATGIAELKSLEDKLLT